MFSSMRALRCIRNVHLKVGLLTHKRLLSPKIITFPLIDSGNTMILNLFTVAGAVSDLNRFPV